MRWIFLGIISLFSFTGCASVQHFDGYLQGAYPSENNDYFVAVQVLNKSSIIIHIDTVGDIHPIQILDSAISHSFVEILNDSIIILRQSFAASNRRAKNSKFVCYNVKSKQLLDSLPAIRMRIVSHDRNYFAVYSNKEEGKFASLTDMYKILGNRLTKLASLQSPGYIYSNLNRNQLLIRMEDTARIKNARIANFDLTITDTISKEWPGNAGNESNALYYFTTTTQTESLYRHDKDMLRYDIVNKSYDTLFTSAAHFEGPISMLDSENYLFKYLTAEEYHKEWERIYAPFEGAFCSTTSETPKCYWAIGNKRNNKIKKIGFAGFSAILDSSHKHMLFFDQDDKEFSMKVVSTKELIDGM